MTLNLSGAGDFSYQQISLAVLEFLRRTLPSGGFPSLSKQVTVFLRNTGSIRGLVGNSTAELDTNCAGASE
jgi:hypothetical protein